MSIRVKKTSSLDDNESLIHFESSLGEASAYWDGMPPKENSTHEVEIEIPGVLHWGNDINEVSLSSY